MISELVIFGERINSVGACHFSSCAARWLGESDGRASSRAIGTGATEHGESYLVLSRRATSVRNSFLKS